MSIWLNVHKPLGISSTQALGRLKRILALPRKTKIGHGGTLDPLAEGVLPVALGEATKTVSCCMDAPKTYRFTMEFGTQTTTDDAEGEPLATSDVRVSAEILQQMLAQYVGVIQQAPPIYSAIKVEGARAYDLARAGTLDALPSREVTIDQLVLLEVDNPASVGRATLRAHCHKGTYIRSLARDLALALGSRAHVVHILRERVGKMYVEDAISLEMLEEMGYTYPALQEQPLHSAWCSLAFMLDDIPAWEIDAAMAAHMRKGGLVFTHQLPQELQAVDQVRCMLNNQLVALAQPDVERVIMQRVFNIV